MCQVALLCVLFQKGPSCFPLSPLPFQNCLLPWWGGERQGLQDAYLLSLSHTGTNPSLPLTFLLLRAQSRGPKWPTGEPGKYRKRIDIWLALHCCRLLQQGWPPRWPGTVWFSVLETPASQENLQSWANWEGWSCYLQPLACTTVSSLPVSTLSRSRLHTFWEQRLGHMELFFYPWRSSTLSVLSR